MARLARDIMTPDPACCSPNTTLDDVARMMVQNDCGEIPIVDTNDRIIGVITDRDIVCRVVAQRKNPVGYTDASSMS
jgi:CBS domain-containing protein